MAGATATAAARTGAVGAAAVVAVAAVVMAAAVAVAAARLTDRLFKSQLNSAIPRISQNFEPLGRTPRSHWLIDELLVVGETRPTTLLFADPPTALAVTAEGASSQLRCACGSFGQRVSCMLAAPRVPTGRFKRGVPAQGESPAPQSWKRRACSELVMWYRKLTILDFETPPRRLRVMTRLPHAVTVPPPA
jgi:hypothetical protein